MVASLRGTIVEDIGASVVVMLSSLGCSGGLCTSANLFYVCSMRIPANNSSHCYKTHDELHYWTICNLPHDSIESLVKSRMAIQRKRGINYDNLRLLLRDPERTKDALQFSMALTNARSLVNKTFIINDLFVSRGLNMLCVPETWLSEGDFSPLSELLPNDCSYINSDVEEEDY